MALKNIILDFSPLMKRVIVIAVDAALCLAALWIALYLRIGEFVYLDRVYWIPMAASLALALPIFIRSGLYRAVFRYSGWPALMTIAKASVLYGLFFSCLITIIGIDGTPRTIGIIQPLVLFVLVGSSRATAHYWLGGEYKRRTGVASRERVLIYGAGSAGQQIAAAIRSNSEFKVLGYLDDNPSLIGRVLNGLTIYGPAELQNLKRKYDVNSVLIAIPSANRHVRQRIIDRIKTENITIRTLPSVLDLAQGRVSISDIKELDLDDLLGRNPVVADTVLLGGAVKGRCVLVTGGGGSIGSELCRQILRQSPSKLIILDHSEFALYKISEELVAWKNMHGEAKIELHAVLASVKDEEFIGKIFDQYQPETVFHAAAYKHVPLVEDNVQQGVMNNILGTKIVAEKSFAIGVKNFILISTDKAVRPTNVMGATKRWAELIAQDIAARAKAEGRDQKFSAVRFGNVIGSSGSVVPLFREQIRQGGPITLTHPDVTRYFMSIEEAVSLVLQAASLSEGEEIFLLDMGEPVLVIDLAKNLIRLSGLRLRSEDQPDGDIEIKVIGLRPGEKMFEELLIDTKSAIPTNRLKIFRAREPKISTDLLDKKYKNLLSLVSKATTDEIKSYIFEIIN